MMAVALAVAPLTPVLAADLDGDAYAPYDEPGYADDGYDDDAPPPPARYGAAPRDSYGSDYDGPGSIKDGYPVPVPAPGPAARRAAPVERYDARPIERARPRYAACLEPHQIRRHLRRGGWRDIRPMGGDGDIVHIRARRFDSSSVFRLRVARCTGEVLAARPYYLRSFAHGERPWRY
jgi:hypothetical protein